MSVPSAIRESSAHPLHRRIRLGVRQPSNWLQLARFAAVGASGYVVNLATFWVCLEVLGAGHRVGAVVAFLVAVTNNFAWNRHWTFRARDHGLIHHQAVRFLTVSIGAFLVAFALLEILVTGLGMAELPAQAVSVLVAMPLNFLGNRLWTFRR